jgi:hypothetical protein
MFDDLPAKLLMQITRGGSEICGPAFTPDGSRLYFSSQRGPSGPGGTGSSGVIYELSIPPRFRAIQKAAAFGFRERLTVARGVTVTSEAVTVDGFCGPLVVSVSQGNEAELRVNDGVWTSEPTAIEARDRLRVRHTSAARAGEVVETVVAIGLPNGASRTETVFFSMTSTSGPKPESECRTGRSGRPKTRR